jgi:hypothetical protein
LRENHFASEQIDAQVQEIRTGWRELLSKSAAKGERLRQASEAAMFCRRMDDMEKW